MHAFKLNLLEPAKKGSKRKGSGSKCLTLISMKILEDLINIYTGQN